MNLHDYWNIRRVLRKMAAQQGIPVFVVKAGIRGVIEEAWDRSRNDPEALALWEKCFPGGKMPTPEEYILHLGRAHERGESPPYLLK